jgi:LmbE family N-acetylglucosaminyl deacetylase
MKKIIFGIFAHPDDEAFGPSGTILQETRDGNDVHLMTLTLGDGGMNPDGHKDLGAVREKEWHKGGELMGAKSMHFLGIKDGCLCNTQLIEAGEMIVKTVKSILENAPKDIEIEFMSIDLNGISGHIDHIVAARAACWAFYRLKAEDERFTRIRLACMPKEYLPEPNTDWLYMEPGRETTEIDEIADNRNLREEIIKIMRAHHSQRGDGEGHIERRGESLGMNYIIDKT